MNTDSINLILQGRFPNPDGEGTLSVPTKSVVIAESLKGREAESVQALGFGGRLAVVSDATTHQVLGQSVERALSSMAGVTSIVLPDQPHADMETARRVSKETASADALIAVGSGTINDLCKFAAAEANKPCAVFATAPSMNGYTSVNAAITVDGLKKSLPAIAPVGVFLDLTILAGAPPNMIRSGLGDSICRPTAQVDWLLAHLLHEQEYRQAPFVLLMEEEEALLAEPEALLKGDLEAMGRLVRTLVLSGFGMTICGGSYPASQGEHLISHYADMMSPPDWPRSFHGEQIGVTTLTMSTVQERMLSGGAPRVSATTVTQADVLGHFGPQLGADCWAEFSQKALQATTAEALNAKLEAHWDDFRERLEAVRLPTEQLRRVLKKVDAPRTPEEVNWPRPFYLDAIRHAREIRKRYTFLDLAGDSGLLADIDFV